MDSKRMMVGILLITAIGLGWQVFLLHEYRIHPEWKRPDQQTTVSPAPSSDSQPTTSFVQGPSTPPATAPTTNAVAWHLVPATMPSEAITRIGSEQYQDPRYHLSISTSTGGAGIEDVVLNQYRQEVDSPELFTFQTPYSEFASQTRAMATNAVVIDGATVQTWNADWGLVDHTDHSVTYSARFAGADDQSIVEVQKQYLIEPATTDPATPQGYEVEVNYSVKNLSPAAHSVSLQFSGPTMPRAETARQETETVAGYDDDGAVRIAHQGLTAYNAKGPSRDFVSNDDKLPLLWLGATSNYFNAIVHPLATGKLASAIGLALNPDSTQDQRLVVIRFTTVNFDISPGSAAQLPLRVFFGPKRRDLLESSYYGSFPLKYNETLILIANWFCGLCTFPWLISFLVGLLRGLHFVLFSDWGLAIIALVCLVRLILHPITKKSQVSMMKMQKLAPEMERLKKKFGDDKDGFQRAQMDLYKTVGFTPVLGCLPMFLQMPIFFALWRALQTTFELRQAPFLKFFGHSFTWIHDLSRPDALYTFAHPVALPFGWQLATINVLPVAMAVVSFINTKYFAPRPAAMSPEQEQQQKMMSWMTLIFPFMFYTFPSGLSLYYLTTTSLGIVESKRIRDHIKKTEAEEAGKGPVIVDAGKISRGGRRKGTSMQAPPSKKGWLARKIEEAQQKAEELAREAERKRKRNQD